MRNPGCGGQRREARQFARALRVGERDLALGRGAIVDGVHPIGRRIRVDRAVDVDLMRPRLADF